MNPRAQLAMAKAEAPRLARWPVFASLLSLASCFALSGTAGPIVPMHPSGAGQIQISLEQGAEPAVMTFQPVAAEDAVEMNAAIPNDSGPILPASPFRAIIGDDAVGTRMTALECLASAIYYEAASESSEGQRAVAQVVLNRVRHPAFPHSICGVVFQGAERTTGCQFTFTCDGSLARPRNPAGWRRAMSVAAAALAGYVERSVGTATHYHTIWVVPYWQSSLTKVTTVGAHIFYRWAGGWGAPAAFTASYAGAEMIPSKLAMLGDSANELGLMGSGDALGGTASLDSYVSPQPSYGPATAQLEAPPRTPLVADEAQGRLLVDERQGTLLN